MQQRRLGVLLIDDNPFLEAAMTRLFKGHGLVQWLGGAANTSDAERAVHLWRPDVALMEVSLGGQSTLDLLSRLWLEGARSRVLVLTAHITPELIDSFTGAGAAGFLGKDVQPQEIVQAIRRAAEGEYVLSQSADEVLHHRRRAFWTHADVHEN